MVTSLFRRQTPDDARRLDRIFRSCTRSCQRPVVRPVSVTKTQNGVKLY